MKVDLPYDPAIPFLGIYPGKTKTLIQKDTCFINVSNVSKRYIYNSQDIKVT